MDNLPKPFFALAPMDDVTDSVFRRTVKGCYAPDIFFTEFVNVDGLQSPGRKKLLKKLLFTESERPLIAQIWGKVPENFYKTARQIADGSIAEELGLPAGVNYAGVDLNMGCPQKKEINGGTCAALMNNRPLASEIIDATREGLSGRMPLSVKTRIGFNEKDLSWPQFLLQKQLFMLTVHGRTRKEMSKVPAHWDAIGEIRVLRDRIAPRTLLVGNGDVLNRSHGLKLAKQHKLDGIMIGRGVFHDPYAFSLSSPWDRLTAQDKIGLYRRQAELFKKTWHTGDRPIHTLNKFCKIYINGFEGCKELREKLMSAQSPDELLGLLNEEHESAVTASS